MITRLLQALHINNYKVILTNLIIVTTSTLALLGIINRLNYASPTTIGLLTVIADSVIWTILFSMYSVVAIVFTFRRKYRFQITATAAGLLGSWGVFNMLWGLSAAVPVTLVGPSFALILSLISWVLAMLWADEEIIFPNSE